MQSSGITPQTISYQSDSVEAAMRKQLAAGRRKRQFVKVKRMRRAIAKVRNAREHAYL